MRRSVREHESKSGKTSVLEAFCVCVGRGVGWGIGCGWGLAAPARSSATISWPCVTCLHPPKPLLSDCWLAWFVGLSTTHRAHVCRLRLLCLYRNVSAYLDDVTLYSTEFKYASFHPVVLVCFFFVFFFVCIKNWSSDKDLNTGSENRVIRLLSASWRLDFSPYFCSSWWLKWTSFIVIKCRSNRPHNKPLIGVFNCGHATL